LKVLRESGFAAVRADGPRRIYSMQAEPLRELDVWLDRFRAFWAPKLEALATEVARGKRQRKLLTKMTQAASRTIRGVSPVTRAVGRRKR
jgi:hypothetical protein